MAKIEGAHPSQQLLQLRPHILALPPPLGMTINEVYGRVGGHVEDAHSEQRRSISRKFAAEPFAHLSFLLGKSPRESLNSLFKVLQRILHILPAAVLEMHCHAVVFAAGYGAVYFHGFAAWEGHV